MQIKYCIFDVGQVCYPFSLEPLENFCRTLAPNCPTLTAFDYKPFMLGKIDFATFCRHLCSYCQIPYTPHLCPLINQKMHEGVGSFYSETIELMDKLRQMNIEICLLSNALPNLEDTADKLTTPDKIFTSYHIGLLKPDPKIYRYVLEKLNALPQETIFIDDKPTNVEAAQKIGIHAFIFNHTQTPQAILNVLNN